MVTPADRPRNTAEHDPDVADGCFALRYGDGVELVSERHEGDTSVLVIHRTAA